MPEIETAHRSLPDLCAERGSAESKSETEVGGCAKAGAAGQNLGESGSGRRRRTSAFDRVQVGTRRGGCAKAGAECKNLGESGSSIGDGRAHSIGYKSERDGGCAKAGAACKNLGESGSSIGDGRAHSIGYKSETEVGGCAKAGAAGQNLGESGSGRRRRTSAFDRVEVGRRRWVREGRS